ncbi:MAG: lipid II flippase MurJ, partial [Acidimicrobiales bacterium]
MSDAGGTAAWPSGISEGAGGERTGKATLYMSVGTLFSRLTGFGRVVALAYALGLTHRLTDAYNLANTTPNIVFDFVLGGVLAATLIPVFVERLATRNEAEAWRAISAVVSLVSVLLVVMTAAFEVASPEFIRIYTFGTAHSAAEDRAATGLLRMFAPQLALYGWIVLSTALLNTRRRFAVPMFTPIANNLLVIFVLLVVRHIAHGMSVGNVSDHPGAYWLLGLGTTAGVVVQLIGQLPALRGAGIRLRWVWDPGHQVVRQMLRLSGWTFGFVATNQVALWVVLFLANRRTGDVTVWVTAYTFFQLPVGIAAVSLMSAIQPALADSWA